MENYNYDKKFRMILF